jgi:hypothetical protein
VQSTNADPFATQRLLYRSYRTEGVTASTPGLLVRYACASGNTPTRTVVARNVRNATTTVSGCTVTIAVTSDPDGRSEPYTFKVSGIRRVPDPAGTGSAGSCPASAADPVAGAQPPPPPPPSCTYVSGSGSVSPNPAVLKKGGSGKLTSDVVVSITTSGGCSGLTLSVQTGSSGTTTQSFTGGPTAWTSTLSGSSLNWTTGTKTISVKAGTTVLGSFSFAVTT